MPPFSASGGMAQRGGKGVEHEARSGIDIDRRVAGNDNLPARSAMRGDRVLERDLAIMIDSACRFIEEPERSRRHDQTGEREPPSLAGGEPAAGPLGDCIERECGERHIDKRRRPAQLKTAERCPEPQRFARRQRRLDAVLMTDIVQARAMLGDISLDRRTPPDKPARRRRRQGGEEPQQAGLAAPIRAGHHEGTTRRQAEGDPRKDEALAAAAREILSDQVGGGLGQRGRPGGLALRVSASENDRTKKRLRRGNPEPRGHGRSSRPCTRFGGQTCKGKPYAYHMGSRLGLRFEKIVTIR